MDSPTRPWPASPLRTCRHQTLYRYCLPDVSSAARVGSLRFGKTGSALYYVRIRARHGQWLGRFLVLLEPDLFKAVPARWLHLGLGRSGLAPAATKVAPRSFSES